MRDFFINAFEKLIGVYVVVMIVVVVISAIGAAMGPFGSGLAALGILIVGGFSVVVTAGLLYLFQGIYQNTKRAADILERRG
jgi:Fe-S cluster assembly ATPase SufC